MVSGYVERGDLAPLDGSESALSSTFTEAIAEEHDDPEFEVGQMESIGRVGLSIWHPFAGYGTRGRHVSWLIDDQGERAAELLRIVRRRFDDREIPEALISRAVLRRKGILVDERPYILVRRKLTTAGLYIARFGKDLYVSQVTYFKGPISNLRILVVTLMLLFYVAYPMLYQRTLSTVSVSLLGGTVGLEQALTIACCVGPFYLLDALALLILCIYSLYRFINEKDILAALREPPGEFDMDDTVALEKAAEETVREGLDAIGVDRKLMPPAEEYGMRRRLI